MTGIEFWFVFIAGAIVGGTTMGLIRAGIHARSRSDAWRELARRQGVYFQRRGRP